MINLHLQGEDLWSSETDCEETDTQQSLLQVENSAFSYIWQLTFFVLLWQSVYKVSNAAITVLFKFLAAFVSMIGNAFMNVPLQKIAAGIPSNADVGHRFLWSGCQQSFVTYVVCPVCDAIYDYDDCFISRNGQNESKLCRNVLFPNHPHASKRKECGALLLKKIKVGKKSKLVSIKAFPYQPLHVSLGRLVCKKDFIESCEMWRQRQLAVPNEYYGDIYDGKVWHEFNQQMQNGVTFLSNPHSYLLTLNVDWFQPFLHTTYSMGAIYLTIQNLPRHMRYKEENVMLVGLIPGPSEPKLNINSYLTPLVEELKVAWEKGIQLPTRNGSVASFRVALSCVSCDIPASRKVCGFLGHNAKLGCNKCLKQFETPTLGQTNYSGFDRGNWPCRSAENHRHNVRETLIQNTKTTQRNKETELGCRYSTLLQLVYFDPVRYTVIDLMHNLYLGTGKYLFKLWVSLGFLGKTELEEIDRLLECFIVPNSIGRLPSNISSNFGGFKAAQWRSWITIFSPVVLKSLLPAEHLRCWLLFVRACSILGHRIVTKSDVESADLLLVTFCKTFQQLYGEDKCTPNMHLHLHLKDCLLDFGPPHSFWCFSFERYNGLLGSFHTNQKKVEVQIMKKFINSQILNSAKQNAKLEFVSLLSGVDRRNSSIITESADDLECLRLLFMSSSTLPNSTLSFQVNQNVSLLPPVRKYVFSSATLKQLEQLYKQLIMTSNFSVSPFYIRSGRVMFCGEVIGSQMNAISCNSSCVILAYWPVQDGPISDIDTTRLRVGCVQYYVKLSLNMLDDSSNGLKQEYICAYVQWKRQHPQESWFGVSAIVCRDEFECSSMYSYIPVQRIHAIGVHGTIQVKLSGFEEKVFVAIPVPLRLSL